MARRQVTSEISGTVWKLEVAVGAAVAEGDIIAIIESMKMEVPIVAPQAGVVRELLVRETETVSEGDTIAVLEG
jgi:acetyl-CoA carboxylase biotin carboxyl carrier protein